MGKVIGIDLGTTNSAIAVEAADQANAGRATAEAAAAASEQAKDKANTERNVAVGQVARADYRFPGHARLLAEGADRVAHPVVEQLDGDRERARDHRQGATAILARSFAKVGLGHAAASSSRGSIVSSRLYPGPAGVASRRQAEQMMVAGRVTVNGSVVTELGSKADLERDHIKVDGRLIHAPRRLIYIVLNKPNNTVTTVTDPQHRATVMELLRGVKERVYPVGRLDYHSEGLLLLTNDGELANAIMSAATHLPKTYVVKVNGSLTGPQEQQFREGIPLSGRRTMPAGLRVVHQAENPWYEVRLFEGRNNQIRLMFKHFGFLVEKLKRVRIGPLELGPLKPGAFRHLSIEEVRKLKRALEPARRRESR